jgi:protein-disulfide isomerase
VSTNARGPSRAEVAREKARKAREAQRAAERRRRMQVITSVAVVVLVVAGAVGFLVSRGGGGSTATPPAGAVENGLALVRGDAKAPATLTMYEDFRCPACKQMEERLGDTVRELVDAGTLQVHYHLASFLDSNLRGSGSHKAANAAACAYNADPAKFAKFHDILYANQPDEREDKFGDVKNLLDLAGQVPGLRSDTFDRCVRDQNYADWVDDVQAEFDKRFNGQIATPTLLLNGKGLQTPDMKATSPDLASPEAFKAAVEKAAKGH